ncbi:hypothetical protein RBB50_008830 [Rhinocladiella similis]
MPWSQEEWDNISYEEKIEAKVATKPDTPLSGEYVNITQFWNSEVQTFELAPARPLPEEIEWAKLKGREARVEEEQRERREEAVRMERERRERKKVEKKRAREERSRKVVKGSMGERRPSDTWDDDDDDEDEDEDEDELPFVIERDEDRRKC